MANIQRGKSGNIKLSIGIISRGRPNYLAATITNWLTTATFKEDLDFVIALDDDDEESIKTYNDMQHIIKFFGAKSSLITWPPVGYINLYKRNNQMLPHYHGDVLMVVCDDQYVTTHGWDKVISDDVNKVYETHGEGITFLVWMCGKNNIKKHPDMYGLNRKWLDIAGKYTITAGTDAYVRDMAKSSGSVIIRPELDVWHLQRKFGHLPSDFIESHRKPPNLSQDKQLWVDKYGEELIKDSEWVNSTKHDNKLYRFRHDELGEEYESIVKKFKDYYGK